MHHTLQPLQPHCGPRDAAICLTSYHQTETNNRRERHVQCSICRGLGVNSHWLRTTPTGDCKVCSGGRIRSPQKGQNANSSLNRFKLMSDIIQTYLQNPSL